MKGEFVIRGAGPAGLAAAITIARAGRRAVVLERRGDVGRRFRGDHQGIENWTQTGDVLEELAESGIEPTFETKPFREAVFFGPSGREARLRSERPAFYLVRRGPAPGSLDSGLKAQAQELGVEIRFEDAARAAGGEDIRAVGPGRIDAAAAGHVFETDAADGLYAALSDHLAPKGYSYLIVSGGRGTVATCLFRDFHRARMYLDRTIEFFSRRVGLAWRLPEPLGGTGNFGYPETARWDGALLAGEAAGFQDALWGFGIRYAIRSGHLAASALLEGRPESYDREWKQAFGGELRASIVNRFIYERMGGLGYGMLLRRLASARDPREWLRRLYRGSPAKDLLFALLRRGAGARRNPGGGLHLEFF